MKDECRMMNEERGSWFQGQTFKFQFPGFCGSRVTGPGSDFQVSIPWFLGDRANRDLKFESLTLNLLNLLNL